MARLKACTDIEINNIFHMQCETDSRCLGNMFKAKQCVNMSFDFPKKFFRVLHTF